MGARRPDSRPRRLRAVGTAHASCCESDLPVCSTSDSHRTDLRACSSDLGADLYSPSQLVETGGAQIRDMTENSAPISGSALDVKFATFLAWNRRRGTD